MADTQQPEEQMFRLTKVRFPKVRNLRNFVEPIQHLFSEFLQITGVTDRDNAIMLEILHHALRALIALPVVLK